jgi:two-component system, OmpR family, sensor histidine kinase MprB
VTFRRRIALVSGVSFAAAVVLCSIAGFLVARAQTFDRFDDDLVRRAVAEDGAGDLRLDEGILVQRLVADGTTSRPPGQEEVLPVDRRDRLVAEADRTGVRRVRRVTVDGEGYRMVTVSIGDDRAVQVARPVAEAEGAVARYGRAVFVIAVTGTALAALLGWVVARRTARPVEELTEVAEHVADTLDVDVRLQPRNDDEIGRLTRSIQRMLGALHLSREQQRRLVADAGHELRTPLTSLRANVGLLDHPDLDEATRRDIVRDLRVELDELDALTEELVALAADAAPDEAATTVDLADVARRVAAQASRRTGVPVEVDVADDGWVVEGRPTALERAVRNLVDNACAWTAPGTAVEVRVEPGRLRVRDHGPGVAPEERDRIFDRFYRSGAARARPGSGLGLAIVRQVVDAHRGEVTVDDAPGGGARFSLRLPPGPPPGTSPSSRAGDG